MAASAFVHVPAFLRSPESDPRSVSSPDAGQHISPPCHPSAAFDFSIHAIQAKDTSTAPSEYVGTPSGSNAALSHYQPSDFSDFALDFNSIHHDVDIPFLEDDTWSQAAFPSDTIPTSEFQYELADPFSPGPLPPAHAEPLSHDMSPESDCDYLGRTEAAAILPSKFDKKQKPARLAVNTAAITPSQALGGHASQDGLEPTVWPIHSQSPIVTISDWDKHRDTAIPACHHAPEDITESRRTGLEPGSRPSGEVPSIRKIAAQRATQEKNQAVGRWLDHNSNDASAPVEKSPEEMKAIESSRNDINDGIPLGDRTENLYVPGRTYFVAAGGPVSDVDREIIASDQNWADPPMIPEIQRSEYGKYQPETSQAAIERFEKMCRDNDSMISRCATWGTRRLSLPSVIDVEGVTSGSFLKRLTIHRGGGEKTGRPGSFLTDLRVLVRRTSVSSLRKRSRGRSCSRSAMEGPYEASDQQENCQSTRREGTSQLSPPPPGSPGNGKKSAPSINTTLTSMGQNIASMWAGHSRSGSVSGTPTTTPPSRASFGSLTVRGSLRRPRSKSEIPSPSFGAAGMEGVSSLVDMWRKAGGPPVAPVNRVSVPHVATTTTTTTVAEDEDDEDGEDGDEDDDELCEDSDMRISPDVSIDDVTPTVAGFRQHVMRLQPDLGDTHGYLVDRIAHQQMERFKQLTAARSGHAGLGHSCPSGSLCTALPSATQAGTADGPEPLAGKAENGGGSPADGAVGQGGFPPGIRMPTAQRFPAEFECQLCYRKKTFRKPSDWTKHVYEDMQPFTCTWDKCRDAKMFKRKADWVRHENECHRHLEWWTCDVDDCRHTCYRRDNFKHHLEREHNYPEPKAKTKAAVKRAGGGMELTWQKVEQCHVETTARPQDEACRFCGKSLPTWKKLTGHLAKHMEQITLPVLRLVALRDPTADCALVSTVGGDSSPRQTSTTGRSPSTPPTAFPGGGPRVRSQQQKQQTASPFGMEAAQAQQARVQQQSRRGHRSLPQSVYPVTVPKSYQQQQQQTCQGRLENTGHGFPQSHLNLGPLMCPRYDANEQVLGTMSGGGSGVYMSPSSPSNSNNPMDRTESSGMEPFPPFTMDALGLYNVAAATMGGQLSGHMGYEDAMKPSSGVDSPYSGHESAFSSFASSPHFSATSNHHPQWQQNVMWGDGSGGFML